MYVNRNDEHLCRCLLYNTKYKIWENFSYIGHEVPNFVDENQIFGMKNFFLFHDILYVFK